MDAQNSPAPDFQWPEHYRPAENYVAPDLKVIEPFGVRFKRLLDRIVASVTAFADDYLYGLHHSAGCRVITIGIVLLIAGTALRIHLQNRPATLQVVCFHPFHAAEIMVWEDGNRVIDDVITGGAPFDAHHWRPYWEREAASYYSVPLTLTRKPHDIRVRVASTEDPYDFTQITTVDLAPASKNTLQVACGKRRMVLAVYDQPK